MLKNDINWPEHRRYKSRTEWEPIGFFSDCLCNTVKFDLMLGFFSSSAISVLADGFATFLYNGGKMRLIINDVLTDEDREAIAKGQNTTYLPFFDLKNISKIKDTLSARNRHFFECLSWLIRNDRIEIIIISPKDGMGISHTKSGVFSDGKNEVAFDGSCNFSRTALIDNIESISIFCDWDSNISQHTINSIKSDFDLIFSGKDVSLNYVHADEIKKKITTNFIEKDSIELLKDEYKYLSNDIKGNLPDYILKVLRRAKNNVEALIDRDEQEKNNVETNSLLSKPSFPYPTGPHDYQLAAFTRWKENNQKGLFAMATGTGKTITSLNCLLEIYNKFKFYKALILVPTVTLVDQWESECKKFNFFNVIKVCSKNPRWKQEINSLQLKEQFASKDDEPSYIIIATYASFARENIFNELMSFNNRALRQMLLIADEAHNMGAGRILDRLKCIKILRRIGLSATPERQYDEVGNSALNEFFGTVNGYTFEYTMREAIDNGYLCRYKYYPHIVYLEDDEMIEYIKISEKLVKFYNFSNSSFPDKDDILMDLLLKRKRIIHKARNKEVIFKKIVEERFKEKGNLRYTLVYVPEGTKPDDESADIYEDNDQIPNDDYSDALIDRYTAIVSNVSRQTTVKKFTAGIKGRSEILDAFAKGEIEVLTSMKCLDEGVDVPRSELAIFCASTGNPRQFIQRRGRILRKHKDKHMAYIHDLIVIPIVSTANDYYTMERNLVANELKRVRDFAILSENANYTYNELSKILTYYNLSLF